MIDVRISKFLTFSLIFQCQFESVCIFELRNWIEFEISENFKIFIIIVTNQNQIESNVHSVNIYRKIDCLNEFEKKLAI